MLKFWSQSKRRSSKNSRKIGLRFERLESRECPANVTLELFNVSRLSGRDIEYSGLVILDGVKAHGADAFQIRLSGVASGVTAVQASGYFQGFSTTVGFGQITAQVFDSQGTPISGTAQHDYQNLAPTISFQVLQSGPAQFRITGTVADEDPQLSTVFISGAGSGNVTPNANGAFSFTFNSSVLGTVQALATDSLGLSSGTTSAPLVNQAPVITSFTATREGSYWVLSGTVADEVPAGLVVRFQSTIPIINGATAVVQSNGSFSRAFLFKLGQLGGLVSASTIDWFGESSNTMFTYVG